MPNKKKQNLGKKFQEKMSRVMSDNQNIKMDTSDDSVYICKKRLISHLLGLLL